MKRKGFAILTTLLLLLSLPLAAFASESPTLVVDSAGLFTAEEAAALEAKAQALRGQYEMDVVILTVNSLDGSRPQDFADNFFDSYGYGCGENYSGALFLISMEQRDWCISTSGDAIYALTDYGIQKSASEALSYFADGDYYGGFDAWLDELPVYFDALRDNAPIDGNADYSGDYYHGDQEKVVYYQEERAPNLFLSLIIGLAVAGISILIMRSSMNTKRSQRGAASYLVDDSFHLRTHQDIFLYSNIQKIPRPKQNSSGAGALSTTAPVEEAMVAAAVNSKITLYIKGESTWVLSKQHWAAPAAFLPTSGENTFTATAYLTIFLSAKASSAPESAAATPKAAITSSPTAA